MKRASVLVSGAASPYTHLYRAALSVAVVSVWALCSPATSHASTGDAVI
jgi:hypothetical protein